MQSPHHQGRFQITLVALALAWCALASWSTARSLDDPTTPSANLAYFPLAAKPIPTPTPTPAPTPTPVPPDVRVDWSCCRIKGPAQDPSDEYVCFRSYDTRPIDMTGWKVQDEAKHTYVFPSFVLPAQAIVTLHSGAGRNTATDLYWGNGAIWNNTHDTIYLYDAGDPPNQVDVYVY